MEPKQYFNELKSEINLMDSSELDSMLTTVENALIQANSVGQTSVVERLIFARSNIAREIKAQVSGIKRYVYKDAIVKFIDEIEPKNSVKIIELDRYPRIIPEKNLADIQRVQKLDLFDKYCVVFTDLSNETIETPEEIAFRDRNRDPIVFGYYCKDKTSLRSDRFYLITDWEDEYCYLTFDSMIKAMSEKDHGDLNIADPNELQRIISEAHSERDEPKIEDTGLFNRLKAWIKK